MSGRRRKSLSIFRPTVTSLTPISDAGNTGASQGAASKKKSRTTSLFSHSPTSAPNPSGAGAGGGSSSQQQLLLPEHGSPALRPRPLHKPGRPSSLFGSLRSLHSANTDDDEPQQRSSGNQTPTVHEEGGSVAGSTKLDVDQMTVMHHGEVQTAGSMFRKRSQYLVLTNTHLLRFKTQARAAEIFGEVPQTQGRSNSMHRHSRMSSGDSDGGFFYAEPHAAIPLRNVVSVYNLDDGRPYFTVELAHYDEVSNHAATVSMQLNDPRECELWLGSIRAAIIKARLTDPMPFGKRAIELAARALEVDADYDPNHFRIFTVVQRATKSGARSSSDDLGKLMSSVFYLVIGFHKVHLVPLPKAGAARSGSSTSLSDLNGSAHALMLLSSVHVKPNDDSFQLGFRLPLHPQYTLYLSSASANDISLCIRQAAEFLRPIWLEPPFTWTVPENLDDALLPASSAEQEEYDCFERTLIAYCVAYNLDPSNIRYTINEKYEDGPEFQLLGPSNSRRTKYTSLELLAILRALRYNECFGTISFRGVKLDALHALYDRSGSEHFLWTTRSGRSIPLPRLDKTPLIVQELQCLTLKSRRIRRYDFSDCLSRKPKDLDSAKDPGTGICEAVFPLCLLQLTNVDWVSLNGLALSEIDIEYLYAAVCRRSSHFRSLDLGRCGLGTETLGISIQGMVFQADTLESLVLSGNPARLNPDFLTKNLRQLKHIRKLDISRLQVDSGLDPLLETDVLLQWRLEYLVLSGNKLNAQSIDAIAAYLVMPESESLRELRMDQCQLHGNDVATLLIAMMSDRTEPRDMHFVVNENRLEKSHSKLASAVARSITPTHLTMQMLEYLAERNFREMLVALSQNTSLRYLDISRASIPYDAGHSTVDEFRRMLETNQTLEELNVSGEQAHLEAVTLGRGLPEALRGLESNRTLKVFRITNQALGLPGAHAVASVLENNDTLEQLHCEDNEISLQGFTTIVNAVRKNTTIQYVPIMDRDRAWSRGKVDREVSSLMQSARPSSPSSTRQNVKRTLMASGRAALSGRNGGSHHSRTNSGSGSGGGGGNSNAAANNSSNNGEKHHHNYLHLPHHNAAPPAMSGGYTEQDVQAAMESLDQKWDSEVARLQGYLRRNYYTAHGIAPDGEDGIINDQASSAAASRPVTAHKLVSALQDASLNRTPTAELDRQLELDPLLDGTYSSLRLDLLRSLDADAADGEAAEKRGDPRALQYGSSAGGESSEDEAGLVMRRVDG